MDTSGLKVKLLMLGIVLGLAVKIGSAQTETPQSDSPKKVVEQFCKMDADGLWLGPEHWDELNGMVTNPKPWNGDGRPLAIARNYVVNNPAENGNSAEFNVDYFVWGDLDPASLRFFRKEGLLSGEPVKRNERRALVFSDRYVTVREGGGQEERTGPLRWRIGMDSPHPHVSVDAAIRYVTEMLTRSNDPILQYNADRTLAALRSILAGTPSRSQHTNPPPESPSQVFQRFYKLEAAGKGLTPEGWRELAEFFVETPKLQGDKILIFDIVDVGEALIEGDTAEIDISGNSLGELDSSLRLTDYPPDKPSANCGCYGDNGIAYTLLLSEKPWDREAAPHGTTAKEFTAPLAWRIYRFDPPEPWITLDTAIRYVTEMRDKTTDPSIKKNADKTLVQFTKLH